MVLASAIRCGPRAVRGCGFGCQRRHLATKWLCSTRRSTRGMLIVQATRNLSFVTLWVGAGTKGRKGPRTGAGVRDQDGQGGGEQGGTKSQAWVVGWVVWGGEGGNVLASEKRRRPGAVCSAFEGGRWVVESVNGGGREGNGRLRCAAGVQGGRVWHGLPWAFTGLFGAGRGFGAWFVESSGKGAYWLGPCFWFCLQFRLGLHRGSQWIGWTVNWGLGGGGRGRRGAEGAVFFAPGVAGGEREGHLYGVPRNRMVA